MMPLIVTAAVLGYVVIGALFCRLAGVLQKERLDMDDAFCAATLWPIWLAFVLIIGFLWLLRWIGNIEA